MSRSPIDILFDRADMRCTKCRAPMGTCDCWTRCACGHLHEPGARCRNPDCEHGLRVMLECPDCGATKRAWPDRSDPPKTARIRLACIKCIGDRETVPIEYFDAEGKEIDG